MLILVFDDNMLQYSCHILTMFQQTMTIKKTPWVVGNSFQISCSSNISQVCEYAEQNTDMGVGSIIKMVVAGRYVHVTKQNSFIHDVGCNV